MANDIVINVSANTQQAQNEIKKVGESTQDVGKKTEKTKLNWVELAAKISVVKDVMGTIKDAMGKVYDVGKELVQEYEKVNNQMTILKSQKVWGDIKVQFDKLEEATGGVIDKFDVLESVNKATSFGIDLTNGRLLKLIDASQKAALTMGTDLKYAFDSLIVGTARESKMILDNLGVMVDIEKANEDYAKSLGKTKDALTEEESKVALLNQVLDELARTQKSISNESLTTSGTGQIAMFERVWRNLKLSAGETLSDIVTAFDEAFMNSRAVAMKHLKQAEEEEKVRRKEIVSETVEILKDIEGDMTARRKKMVEETLSVESEYYDFLKESQDAKKQREDIINESIKQQEDYIKASTKVMNEKQQRYYLLNYIEDTYGEKVRARYELELSKGGDVIEILNKQSDAVGFASQNAANYFNFLQKINDLQMFEEEFTVRGQSSYVDEKQIKKDADLNKKRADKISEINRKARQKEYEDNIRAAEEQAKLMKEYFADGGLLDQIQTKQREEDLKDERDLANAKEKARKDLVEKTINEGVADKIRRINQKTEEIRLEMETEEMLYNMKIDYQRKLSEEDKKARDMDLKERERYFNMFSSLASQSIDAIFEGNADAFLENLLNFANSFGTTLIMDGIKTLWMGNAQNALFPGLGSSATAVGASEIAIGTAMKAGAYLGGSFSGSTNSSEGSSATEKSQSSQPLVLNVTTSLFGSEKQARKELNGLMRG